jgi:hypothetical protein
MPTNWKIKIHKTTIFILFYMGDLSPQGKNIEDRECLGTRCWGEYLDLQEK